MVEPPSRVRYTELHWQSVRRVLRGRIPARLLPWLLDDDSLTRRLVACCNGAFRVHVLAQQWTRPRIDEARALGIAPGERAWVREVLLTCAGTPWVYARTVIPRRTLTGRERRLTRLRNRSLGAVLFADPHMRRGMLELTRLDADSALRWHGSAPRTAGEEPLWGRRSIFRLSRKPLLVSEFFLPAIPEFRG